MGITLITSIGLNLILIPVFQNYFNNGAIGAAVTVVVSNFLMFLLGMRVVPKIIKYRPMKIISTFIKVLLAALIMSLLVILLKSSLNIIITIILGGGVYFIALFLIGGFKKEDVVSIYNSFIKKNT